MADCFDPWLTGLRSADALMTSGGSVHALAARQAQRWHALRESAASGSRFYRDRLKRTEPLQEIAPVTKRELMQNFDKWVTDPSLTLDALRSFLADGRRIGEAYAGTYVVWESSGSQGDPGVFVQDANAMAVYDALEACRRRQRWVDPWYLGARIAFVGATSGHFASTVTAQRLRRLNPAMAANLRALSFLQPTGKLVDELNDLAPRVISTYPTMAVLLAEEKAAGRLRASPGEVWTGGETLTVAMRSFIERTFGCKVVNSYGASEFLPLASECRLGALHLNSDWAILEPVDEHARPVPAGVTGHTTLLTNLANHLQPLIRYDLGDRVTMHARPCGCGSPLPVIDVQGRCDDMLMLRGSSGQRVHLSPLALTTVIEDDAGVFDFQLTQTASDVLRLSVGGDAAAALRADRALRTYLEGLGVRQVRLSTAAGGAHRRGRTGKLRRVVAAVGAGEPSSSGGAGRCGRP